ncbi:EAL domain-containing protein [Pseudomonas chlororaphis]|uniref:EAL domain-containing protein n=1 Tax=Pseudomonas chlororaphis TaxID=587753 RepID=UPI001E36E0D3|nr:EAL domain-containing protein [Pseudomonas chlororaphis]MCB2254978.1 EAL domain-containing protein [Pseudomonas chlororaphis]
MTDRLSGSDSFHIEHVESLSSLRLHKQPVDIVMAEIHADQSDSLMLPCWVSELNASSRLRRIPHIVWTIRNGTPDHAISLVAGIEHDRTDMINGISSTALASHASLTRASGIRVEIVAENHPTHLLQVLERLACTEHRLPLLSQSDKLELLLSEDEVVSVMATGEDLRVVLQPQYDLASRRVVGAEALIRWRHPLHGDIPLSILIPMVDQLGLDLLLFSYIEKSVIEILGTLAHLGIDIPIAINASARTLCAAGLATRLAAKMHKAGLPTRRLKIELTEQMTPDNELALSASIMALRAKGFLISLGDFDAGAATLALLARIPFDEMKIDEKSVRAAGRSPQSSEIISGIINLARFFNLNLVTGGIEDPASIELLNRLGCSTGQGFALAHPLEQDDFLSLVAR